MSLDLKRLVAQSVIPRLVKMHIQAHLGQSKDHFLEIFKSHFRCNFLFREELMMCTNDPEAGRNHYFDRDFFIFSQSLSDRRKPVSVFCETSGPSGRQKRFFPIFSFFSIFLEARSLSTLRLYAVQLSTLCIQT